MMLDGDPPRLLNANLSGSTRELLLAAKSEAAPRAVRERVLATFAAAFARARADAASAPIRTLSGVFEKRPRASEASAVRRGSERRVPVAPVGATGLASAGQLAAAVIAGVLAAKGAHLAASSLTIGRADPSAIAAEPIASGPIASGPITAEPVAPKPAVPRTSPLVAVPPTLPAPTAPLTAALASGARASSPRAADSAGQGGGGLDGGGLAGGARGSRNEPLSATGRAPVGTAPDELAAEPARRAEPARGGPDADDWLGQQLALLSLAEHRLHEGNPDDALRSIDEYQARFPKGLLDLQIAALRERAQRRASTFIFP